MVATKKNNRIILICIISITVSALAFLLLYYNNRRKEFDYSAHLKEKVLSISDMTGEGQTISIDMQEMAYYIINVEGDINDMAYQYNSKSPMKFWNLKIKTTYTMHDYAKDMAKDSCVRDNIYYMEGVKHGVQLTNEDDKLIAENVYAIMKNLSGKQMELSDFSYETLYNIEKKLFIASKYVNALAEKDHENSELELDGEYYNEIKSKYEVNVEEIWDNVRLGQLSVN